MAGRSRPSPHEWRVGLATLATLAGAAALLLRYATVGRSAQVFGPSVYRRVARGGQREAAPAKTIALTFDDGPSPGTLALADYLESQGIRATFFVCGANLLRHPEIAPELHRRGHQLANHTFTHLRLAPRFSRSLNLLSPERIFRELASTQLLIRQQTGVTPGLFRAPYGMRWFGLRSTQRRLGLLGVMWTVIAHDWEWPVDRVVRHLLRRASPGGILCLHDGRDIRPDPDISVTLAAVQQVVPELRRRGYTLTTVEALLR